MYAPSNYDLEGLSWEERAIVLLYAAGRTEWMDDIIRTHLDRIPHPREDEDLYGPLGTRRYGAFLYGY